MRTPADAPTHGTPHIYVYYGCRCDLCTEAATRDRESRSGTLLTTKEAALKLGLDESSIRRLILEGKLPATKFGRSHQITMRDLSKFKRPALGRPPKVKLG